MKKQNDDKSTRKENRPRQEGYSTLGRVVGRVVAEAVKRKGIREMAEGTGLAFGTSFLYSMLER